MTPEEEGPEDGFGHDVQNAVEDGFGIGSDDVPTFGDAPRNRIQEPEEDGPGAADEVRATDVGAQGGSLFARGPGHGPCDPQEGDAAKGEISPLPSRRGLLGDFFSFFFGGWDRMENIPCIRIELGRRLDR